MPLVGRSGRQHAFMWGFINEFTFSSSDHVFWGAQVYNYEFSDQNRTALRFTLDGIPRRTATLMLAPGVFTGINRCIKLSDQLFEHASADVLLGELVLKEGCIRDKLRYDEVADTYRIYKPSNGVWKVAIKDSDDVRLVAETIRGLLLPMYELQSFREKSNPHYNRKNCPIRPKSEKVRSLIGKYSQKLKNVREVLAVMKSELTFNFSANQHPHLLGCFENGVVCLRTGALLGPALADWGMTQTIPRAYKTDVDTAEINEIMQSFFPEACYPGDSVNLLKFYQGWKGYSLTGYLNLQRALFVTGHGSNGKSILNNLDTAAWGDEIYRNLSMASFTQEGSSNNDHLYQIRNTRSACIVENTTTGKMNEEIFKKVLPLLPLPHALPLTLFCLCLMPCL
jgi:D5 N terminal like